MKKKLMTALGITGLGVVLLSFANSNEPKMKRYEVIRSMNGEVTVFDTLVPENSTFTPDDYLAQLGFDSDEHIQIIQLPSFEQNRFVMSCPASQIHLMPCMDSVVIRSFSGTHEITDSVFTFSINVNEEMTDEAYDKLVKENRIMLHQVDSMNGEIMEIEQIIQVHITDSMFGPDRLAYLDSMSTTMHTIVIHNEEGSAEAGHMRINTPEGEPDFERHMEEGSMKSDFKIYGEQEDFTILLVSNETPGMVKTQVQPMPVQVENPVKIYPNPADKEVSFELNFETKASTVLFVSNANGKEVMRIDLGDLSGHYIQTIDVSKWSKGIYFVNIDRPGVRLVEKLVVE